MSSGSTSPRSQYDMNEINVKSLKTNDLKTSIGELKFILDSVLNDLSLVNRIQCSTEEFLENLKFYIKDLPDNVKTYISEIEHDIRDTLRRINGIKEDIEYIPDDITLRESLIKQTRQIEEFINDIIWRTSSMKLDGEGKYNQKQGNVHTLNEVTSPYSLEDLEYSKEQINLTYIIDKLRENIETLQTHAKSGTLCSTLCDNFIRFTSRITSFLITKRHLVQESSEEFQELLKDVDTSSLDLIKLAKEVSKDHSSQILQEKLNEFITDFLDVLQNFNFISININNEPPHHKTKTPNISPPMSSIEEDLSSFSVSISESDSDDESLDKHFHDKHASDEEWEKQRKEMNEILGGLTKTASTKTNSTTHNPLSSTQEIEGRHYRGSPKSPPKPNNKDTMRGRRIIPKNVKPVFSKKKNDLNYSSGSDSSESDTDDPDIAKQRAEFMALFGTSIDQLLFEKEETEFQSKKERLKILSERLDEAAQVGSHATYFIHDTMTLVCQNICQKVRYYAENCKDLNLQLRYYELAEDMEDSFAFYKITTKALYKCPSSFKLIEELENKRKEFNQVLEDICEVREIDARARGITIERNVPDKNNNLNMEPKLGETIVRTKQEEGTEEEPNNKKEEAMLLTLNESPDQEKRQSPDTISQDINIEHSIPFTATSIDTNNITEKQDVKISLGDSSLAASNALIPVPSLETGNNVVPAPRTLRMRPELTRTMTETRKRSREHHEIPMAMTEAAKERARQREEEEHIKNSVLIQKARQRAEANLNSRSYLQRNRNSRANRARELVQAKNMAAGVKVKKKITKSPHSENNVQDKVVKTHLILDEGTINNITTIPEKKKDTTATLHIVRDESQSLVSKTHKIKSVSSSPQVNTDTFHSASSKLQKPQRLSRVFSQVPNFSRKKKHSVSKADKQRSLDTEQFHNLTQLRTMSVVLPAKQINKVQITDVTDFTKAEKEAAKSSKTDSPPLKIQKKNVLSKPLIRTLSMSFDKSTTVREYSGELTVKRISTRKVPLNNQHRSKSAYRISSLDPKKTQRYYKLTSVRKKESPPISRELISDDHDASNSTENSERYLTPNSSSSVDEGSPAYIPSVKITVPLHSESKKSPSPRGSPPITTATKDTRHRTSKSKSRRKSHSDNNTEKKEIVENDVKIEHKNTIEEIRTRNRSHEIMKNTLLPSPSISRRSTRETRKSGRHTSSNKTLTIQILKGENLVVPNKQILGNPYLKIKVKTPKGLIVQHTKAKVKQMNPVWSEEKFVFQNPIFPIQCTCLSSNKINIKLKEKKSQSVLDDFMGDFFINQEHFPKLDQSVQIWFTLIQKILDDNENKARIYVELLYNNF